MHAYTHDEWAGLSYIPALGEDTRPPGQPTWVDDVDARRLTAYRVLAAYRDNTRRYYLPDEQWDARIENVDGLIRVNRPQAGGIREYGDCGLLVDTARALILGEDQSIEFPADQTVQADGKPADPSPVDAWVYDWAARERLTQKLLAAESDAVSLGDSVYVLAPDAGKQRPRLRVYDPGFYFPDTQTTVPGWVEDDFPPIVHIAWDETDAFGVTWVVRSTWRMAPLEQPKTAPWGGSMTWTCLFRKARYRIDRLRENASIYTDDLARDPDIVQDWTDLGVDFIPVVHVPNTPTGSWGKSILVGVGQIMDDLMGADTDLATGAQTSASPAFVTTAPVAPLSGVPGEQLGLPMGASGAWTDTSKNLAALTGYVSGLLDRVAVNTRLAQALLGRVQPNDVPSGYALQLGFHPARQLMREARTVRDEKYPLLLRFTVRLAQANGWLAPGETPEMAITLGASLPADLPAAVDTVKALLPVHGMSVATAVRVLVQAGLPIEDAEAEVAAIRKEWFDAAVKIFEATGNATAAAQMLGIDSSVTALLTQGTGQGQ